MLVQLRSNSILFFLVNAFGLLDFQCVIALQDWRQRYGRTLRIWLQDIGELESYLISCTAESGEGSSL